MSRERALVAPSWWRSLLWRPWSMRLDPVARQHATPVAALLTTEIARWLNIGELEDMQAGTPVWAGEADVMANRGEAFRYVIFHESVLAGVIEVRPDAVNGHIGYWLTASSRGKGVVTRANRLALLIAFQGLGLKAVDWTAADGNDASIAVMERLGGAFLDRYPTPGRPYRDAEVRYRLERRRFRAADGAPRNLRELLASV